MHRYQNKQKALKRLSSKCSQNMHGVLVFSYLGAAMLSFIFSGIVIKCMSHFWIRLINRQSQDPAAAQSAASGRSGYREVVMETSASRVEVVVESVSSSNSEDSNGNNDKEKKERLNNCTICICEIEEGDVCWELTACKHRFHADCIQKWLKKKKSCPLCRTVIIVHTM